MGRILILRNAFQVEELALNSMIRRANSAVQPQVKKESTGSAKTHGKHKETEVFYFLLSDNCVLIIYVADLINFAKRRTEYKRESGGWRYPGEEPW